MSARLRRQFVTPAMIPIGVAIVAAILIVVVGETLLRLYDPHGEKDSLARPELWFAIGLSMLGLAVAGFLATRPAGTVGLLEQEVVVGGRSIFAPEPPPLDEAVRSGPPGTVADVGEGYTLYARNGALARVLGVVPGSNEFGRRFSGYLYASGLYGASDQLWIPFEAVYAVYPETKSAFLAIKGDETEHFGWNRAPGSLRRAPHASHFPRTE